MENETELFIESLQSKSERETGLIPDKGLTLLGAAVYRFDSFSAWLQELNDCPLCFQTWDERLRALNLCLQAQIDHWKSAGHPQIKWPEWVLGRYRHLIQEKANQ